MRLVNANLRVLGWEKQIDGLRLITIILVVCDGFLLLSRDVDPDRRSAKGSIAVLITPDNVPGTNLRANAQVYIRL